MKYFLTSVFILISLNLFANEGERAGYIIKSNGDTLQGFLIYQNSLNAAKTCKFRAALSENYEEFKPGEIKAYRFNDDKYYVSRLVKVDTSGNTNIVFLEYLINGVADIYYYADVHGDHYYIEKVDDILIELPDIVRLSDGVHMLPSQYKGLLRSILFDGGILEDEIDNTSLTHKSLIKLARNYHTLVCPEESCIVFEKPNLKSKMQLVFVFAPFLNQYNFGKRLLSSYGIGYQVGITLKFKNVFLSNERFSLNIGMLMEKGTKYTMSVPEDQTLNYNVSYNDVDYVISSQDAIFSIPSLTARLNVYDLKIPVMINYNYRINRSVLFGGIGITDKLIISTNKNYRDLLFYEQYGRTFNRILLGGIGNIGFNRQMENGHSIGLNFTYEYLVDPGAVNMYLRLNESQFSFQITYGL